jgi:predicted enzyme related to lactoylglutathione lyase
VLENRSMPSSTVIPELACRDVLAASEWLCGAFGFSQRVVIGDHRVQMSVQSGDAGGHLVLVGSADGTPASTMVRVDDADGHCERARAFGAQILNDPTDYPYGERQYNAVDPEGHRWTFSQTVADVDPRTWGGEIPA